MLMLCRQAHNKHKAQRDPSARQQLDPTVSLEYAHDPPVSSRQPPQNRGATIQTNGVHQPHDWQASYFLNLAIIGWVLASRLFGVPPVDAGGVVGNIALFHQYMAYTSSDSLKKRCRRGYAGGTFPSNRHTHDMSGFFP